MILGVALVLANTAVWVFLAAWLVANFAQEWKWIADKTFCLVPSALLIAAIIDGATGNMRWWNIVAFFLWAVALPFEGRLKGTGGQK